MAAESIAIRSGYASHCYRDLPFLKIKTMPKSLLTCLLLVSLEGLSLQGHKEISTCGTLQVI
jgi:hypothetical protein